MKLPTSKELGSVRYHQQRLHGTGLASTTGIFDSPPTTPKKVPPTPNNTPVSSPVTSTFSSPATLVGESVQKAKKSKKPGKMAKQNGARAEKRHLVRWTDAMDKKLILALQYCCNLAGLTMPWNEIGAIMGEGITGGAVIQHMAKLRTRMVEQNLPVPPPLRRGGGGPRISTSASSRTKAKVTPAKKSKASNVAPKKTKKGSKKVNPGSDDSEEEGDGWSNDDSDAEYGDRPAKRAKATRTRKMKTDSDDEIVTPSRPSKRKFQDSKSSHSQSHDEVEVKTEYTATGASWLRLEDDEDSHPKTGKKAVHKKPSLMVSLPVTVGELKANTGETTDDENEDGMVGGGVGAYADVLYDFGHEEVNEGFSTSPYEEAQMDGAPNATNDVQLYNNKYNTNAVSMPFSGEFTGTSNNEYYDSTSNSGGNFDLGHTSTTFHNQNAGHFPQYDGEFSGVFNSGLNNAGSFGSGDIFSDNVGSAYHVDNGYGSSSNVIGTNDNISLRFNAHDNAHNIPHPIQTSWPTIHSTTGLSNKTSVNQTPADTSAGVDVSAGYFGENGQFNFSNFDDAVVDYSTNGGTDMLFGAGDYNGNVVGGGFFGSNPYGN